VSVEREKKFLFRSFQAFCSSSTANYRAALQSGFSLIILSHQSALSTLIDRETHFNEKSCEKFSLNKRWNVRASHIRSREKNVEGVANKKKQQHFDRNHLTV
jgi:hypothetical protein